MAIKVAKSPGSPTVAWVVLFTVLVLMFLFGKWVLSPDKTASTASPSPTVSSASTAVDDTAAVTGHLSNNANGNPTAYTIISKAGNNKKVVTFQPYLPAHDDAIFLVAARDLTNRVYGQGTLSDMKVGVEQINGIGTIVYRGSGPATYFVPIKESTGEISAMTFWRQ